MLLAGVYVDKPPVDDVRIGSEVLFNQQSQLPEHQIDRGKHEYIFDQCQYTGDNIEIVGGEIAFDAVKAIEAGEQQRGGI